MFYVSTRLGGQPWFEGEGKDILISAGTAWKNPGKSGAEQGFDIDIPEHEELFVDSGGFQATVHFESEYPYSPAQLFTWAEDVNADYCAGMDFACEEADKLAEDLDGVDADAIPSIDERIELTIEKQIEQYELYSELAGREEGWSFQFVPVVQGNTIEEYRYCAQQLKAAGLAKEYMSIGSTCKRDSPSEILAVLNACRDVLPGTEFHLFGATRRIWKSTKFHGRFASADTHAWAVSHPKGGWPANKKEVGEAYVAFEKDISETIDRIGSQSTIEKSTNDNRDQHASLLPGNLYEEVCDFCETPIPLYGIDFSPGCTACEQIKRERSIYARSCIEQEIDSAIETEKNKATSSTQVSLSDSTWG